MNEMNYPDGHLDNEISLDQIISEVSKYHIKVIEGLQRSSDVTRYRDCIWVFKKKIVQTIKKS